MERLEFKGTKGMWYVDESNPTIIWHPTIIGEQLASLPNLIQLEGAEHGLLAKYSKDEALANAKLISMSPQLLKCLQDMVEMYEDVQPCGGYQGYYEEAIDIIKKALL
jgi:hypothetical protein